MQRLEAQAAQIYARARWYTIEHDLLHEDVEYAALHGRLEITGGCGKMAEDDREDIVPCATSLQADGRRRRRMSKNEEKMRGDVVPSNVQRPIHKALNIEHGDAAQARNAKVAGSLFGRRPFSKFERKGNEK